MMDSLLEHELTFWEAIASNRWGQYVSATEKRAILLAHERVPQPDCALEIGCEGGRWSQLLADLGWQMICTDIKPHVLQTCKSRLPEAVCLQVDAATVGIPLQTDSIGLLLCIEVPVIERDEFIVEAHRVLRPQGLFVGVCLNLFSLRGLLHASASYVKRSANFYQVGYRPWRKKLRQAGFRILHEEGFCWFPFGRESNSRLVPICSRAERALRLHRLPTLSPWIAFVAQKIDTAAVVKPRADLRLSCQWAAGRVSQPSSVAGNEPL